MPSMKRRASERSGARATSFNREETPGSGHLATFQAAGLSTFLTQGIGLRPQPWAGLCRPVGPGFPEVRDACSCHEP
jgi:hypothetical protein